MTGEEKYESGSKSQESFPIQPVERHPRHLLKLTVSGCSEALVILGDIPCMQYAITNMPDLLQEAELVYWNIYSKHPTAIV